MGEGQEVEGQRGEALRLQVEGVVRPRVLAPEVQETRVDEGGSLLQLRPLPVGAEAEDRQRLRHQHQPLPSSGANELLQTILLKNDVHQGRVRVNRIRRQEQMSVGPSHAETKPHLRRMADWHV